MFVNERIRFLNRPPQGTRVFGQCRFFKNTSGAGIRRPCGKLPISDQSVCNNEHERLFCFWSRRGSTIGRIRGVRHTAQRRMAAHRVRVQGPGKGVVVRPTGAQERHQRHAVRHTRTRAETFVVHRQQRPVRKRVPVSSDVSAASRLLKNLTPRRYRQTNVVIISLIATKWAGGGGVRLAGRRSTRFSKNTRRKGYDSPTLFVIDV